MNNKPVLQPKVTSSRIYKPARPDNPVVDPETLRHIDMYIAETTMQSMLNTKRGCREARLDASRRSSEYLATGLCQGCGCPVQYDEACGDATPHGYCNECRNIINKMVNFKHRLLRKRVTLTSTSVKTFIECLDSVKEPTYAIIGRHSKEEVRAAAVRYYEALKLHRR